MFKEHKCFADTVKQILGQERGDGEKTMFEVEKGLPLQDALLKRMDSGWRGWVCRHYIPKKLDHGIQKLRLVMKVQNKVNLKK